MRPFGKAVIVSGASLALLFLTLSCGGGGGGDGAVKLTGTVRAPGGTVAFVQPTRLQRFFAGVAGIPAYASIEGLAGVANATVELVEVDADGMEVSVLATATTDSNGAYSIETPEGFTADTRYIVRVTGTTDSMESRVTGTQVDIDPVTDAASAFVTENTSAEGLSAVTINEAEEILEAVDDVAGEIDPVGMDSAELTDALTTAASNSEEAANIISSTVASGEICGTVTDSSSNGMADIRIAAFDFENQVTRARTKTAADGIYCLNLPVQGDTDVYTGRILDGEYTLAALNRTGDTNDPGRHASEFYSASGDTYNALTADKLTLTPASPTLTGIDLQLEPGARITGTVTGHDTAGAGLEGTKITVRDFDTRIVFVSAATGSDGTYRVNVIPGRYLVSVRNTTIKPYASEVYDGGTGTHNRNFGIPVIVTAGEVRTVDFELEAGSDLSGTVTDGASDLPVTGMGVYIDDADSGGSANRLRTNKIGFYRIWLRPESYDILVYGQRSLDLNLSTDQVADFSATVSSISGTVQDSGSSPVREVKMRLYDASRNLLSRALTNSDGTYHIYTDQTGDHRLEARIDGPGSWGGQMYVAHTRHDNGDLINIPSAGSSATADMTLPAGGMLKMIAYEGNGSGMTPDRSAPVPNERFQIRDDDNLAAYGGSTSGTAVFFGIRTRGDGSVTVTIPAGMYDRLHLPDIGSGACGTFSITAGLTTIAEYFIGDNTCIYP